jgi:hypothetical protein
MFSVFYQQKKPGKRAGGLAIATDTRFRGSKPGRKHTMTDETSARFVETQRFPGWGYAVLAGAGLLPFLLASIAGGRIGPGLGIGLAPALALTANLLFMKTEVDAAALTVTFGYLFPLYRRRVPLAEILRAEPVTYAPLGEYGGWGIRGFGDDMALNARGDRGVRLQLTRNRLLLIGSQRPDELAAVLSLPR